MSAQLESYAQRLPPEADNTGAGVAFGGLKREGTQTSLRSGNGSSASDDAANSPHGVAKAVFFKVSRMNTDLQFPKQNKTEILAE